ncbi:nuclear transport factor 2 family protein [Streptomyces sp. NPDC017993]|uniref:nuclear transport factor 2 family protein n=1 Tax=Streptomyces sp. NPDC017993 TaxID=3365027 RepID=UPI0037AEF067
MTFSQLKSVDERVERLVHRTEVAELLDRYLVGLDEQRLDDGWAESLFTTDACVEFPVGRHEGIAGLAAFHRTAMAKFARTQHLNSGAVVDIEGERATVRANLISTQVLSSQALFTTGTFARGEARLGAEGWRFQRLSFALVWSSGEPPALRT